MNKILVIGCPGSGKTTFSKKLSEKLQIPLFIIDSLYYGDNWEKVSQEELKEKLTVIMEEGRWVLDGNYTRLIPYRMQYSDTVIFFDFPKLVVLLRICKRYIAHKGPRRPGLIHQIKLLLTYPDKLIYEMLENNSEDNEVIIFKRPKDADIFLT